MGQLGHREEVQLYAAAKRAKEHGSNQPEMFSLAGQIFFSSVIYGYNYFSSSPSDNERRLI